MAVIRVEKNSNYTTMSNYHLKDRNLSLKTIGLMSIMLSLPDNWDYSIAGLSAIVKDGKDSVRTSLKELEDNKYLVRNRVRDEKGHLKDTEYVLFENPMLDKPILEKPKSENPILENPMLENPTQLNTNISNTNKQNTNISNTNKQNNNLKVISDTDVSRVKEAWNSLSLSNIVSIKGNRAKMLNARIKEYGIDNVLKAISSINNSKFLKGQNDRSWIISFDWFVKPNNFVKVLEGNYIDKGEKNNDRGLKSNPNESESRVPREEATDAYSIAKQFGYI